MRRKQRSIIVYRKMTAFYNIRGILKIYNETQFKGKKSRPLHTHGKMIYRDEDNATSKLKAININHTSNPTNTHKYLPKVADCKNIILFLLRSK